VATVAADSCIWVRLEANPQYRPWFAPLASSNGELVGSASAADNQARAVNFVVTTSPWSFSPSISDPST
jgi:hypothetical protein